MYDWQIIEDEQNRVHPYDIKGELALMIESDLYEWSKDMIESDKDTIVLYAIDRGWLQPYVDGFEIVH